MVKSIVLGHSKWSEHSTVMFVREHRTKTYTPSISTVYLLEDMLNAAVYQDLVSVKVRVSRTILEVLYTPHSDMREYQFDGHDFWNKR